MMIRQVSLLWWLMAKLISSADHLFFAVVKG